VDIPNDWWRTFFKGAPVEMWLQAVPPEMTRQEVDFLHQVLRLEPPAKVLDVPCGGGRHALALTERGFQVTGVDLSTDFLTAARAGSAERSLAVTWEQREMRDLPWRGEFDATYCLGNSFGYLDDQGNADFLKAVGAALKPGARFVLNTGTCAESVLPNYRERFWYLVGDLYFLVQNRYDHVRGRLETGYTFIRDGRVEAHWGFQRVYPYRQLVGLLEDAGFQAVDGYSSLSLEPYRMGAQQLFLVATKKE
jgi:SAM-dependent methyltransferase